MKDKNRILGPWNAIKWRFYSVFLDISWYVLRDKTSKFQIILNYYEKEKATPDWENMEEIKKAKKKAESNSKIKIPFWDNSFITFFTWVTHCSGVTNSWEGITLSIKAHVLDWMSTIEEKVTRKQTINWPIQEMTTYRLPG